MAFAALSAGVSGLQAFSDGVGVIADNITNVNTVGYKESRSRFVTLVTETSTLTSFSPGGVQAATQTLVGRQGLLQASSSSTDLSVDGAGFFTVREIAEDDNSPLLFTRAGSFTTDADGFFVNAAGFNLLGFQLDSNGAVVQPSGISAVSSDGTPATDAFQVPDNLRPVNIRNLNLIGEATSEVSLRVNLQSSTPQQTIATTGTGATVAPLGAIANGTDAANGGTNTAVTADFETSIQVFDSLGEANTFNIQVSKTSSSTWAFDIVADQPANLDLAHRNAANGGTSPADGLIASGVLAFNPDGSFDRDASTMVDVTGTSIGFDNGIPFTYSNETAVGSTDAQVDPGLITFDFGSNNGLDGFTTFDSTSTLLSADVDGALLGDVNGVSIRENGDVVVLFDNGETVTAFRLPVATFPNPDGLERRQGNAYGASDRSGGLTLQTPGSAGSGSIAANSLEQSTVDLANEFAELIRVQRAFSASTRIISTSDEILEELTRL